jgi:hypothetical protein
MGCLRRTRDNHYHVDVDVQYSGSVKFHMPHPEPLVDAIKLRGFGKRLHKWFGWTNETFILRPRKKQ